MICFLEEIPEKNTLRGFLVKTFKKFHELQAAAAAEPRTSQRTSSTEASKNSYSPGSYMCVCVGVSVCAHNKMQSYLLEKKSKHTHSATQSPKKSKQF